MSLSNLLFPTKCVLCERILERGERDLCSDCRIDAPECPVSRKKLPFIHSWVALWHYEGCARQSVLRYKFRNRRSYAQVYGRLLAEKLRQEYPEGFDILTWVPVSPLRRLKRGYDQVELLAKAVGAELSVSPTKTLRKIRNTPPQSRIRDAAHRRANVLGAYRAYQPEAIRGKRILLLDDIITTGATASECARVLLTAGAKEVCCAAIAVTNHNSK